MTIACSKTSCNHGHMWARTVSSINRTLPTMELSPPMRWRISHPISLYLCVIWWSDVFSIYYISRQAVVLTHKALAALYGRQLGKGFNLKWQSWTDGGYRRFYNNVGVYTGVRGWCSSSYLCGRVSLSSVKKEIDFVILFGHTCLGVKKTFSLIYRTRYPTYPLT